MNTSAELDITNILSGFYRRKSIIVSVFIVVSCLSVYLASILPDMYRSSTLILITPQRIPSSFVASTITMSLTERMQSIIQGILSRTQLEKILQEFEPGPPAGKAVTMEDRVEALRRAIGVSFRQGNVFELSFQSRDPERAKQVASRLASLFIEENLQVREQEAIGTKSFIDSEAERLRKELDEQEADVNRFKAANRFELPDQLDANLRTIEQLRLELQSSLSRLTSLQERKGALEKQLVETEVAGPELGGVKGAQGGQLSPANVLIQSRQRELDGLLGHYSAKYPDVIRLQNEIAAAKANIKTQKSKPGDSIEMGSFPTVSPLAQVLQKQITGLDAETKSLQSQIESLRQQVAMYQTRVDNTPVRGIELSKISRTYDITLRKYQDLLAKGLDSELSENMEKKQKGEQFQILDPANFPLKPFSPNRIRIVLFGLLAGLAGGFGLAFLWENLDTSFKRGDEINAYVNLPLLATIPALLTRGSVLDERRAQGYLVFASVGVLVVGLVCIRIFGPMYF